MSFSKREVSDLILKHEKDPCPTACVEFVKLAQRRYGSIEGIKKEFLRRRDLKKARTLEYQQILQYAPDRVKELNDWFKNHGFEDTLFEVEAQHTFFDFQMTPLAELLSMLGVFNYNDVEKFTRTGKLRKRVMKRLSLRYHHQFYVQMHNVIRFVETSKLPYYSVFKRPFTEVLSLCHVVRNSLSLVLRRAQNSFF